jgi:hypothetical protein
MFDKDPIMMKGIFAFVVPSALGATSYAVANLVARFISPVPRHVYIGRLVLLAVLILLIWMFCLPYAAEAFTGPHERYVERGVGTRSMGILYGLNTMWIWFVIALLKRPRTFRDESAS